jgi:hypothetical protein
MHLLFQPLRVHHVDARILYGYVKVAASLWARMTRRIDGYGPGVPVMARILGLVWELVLEKAAKA